MVGIFPNRAAVHQSAELLLQRAWGPGHYGRTGAVHSVKKNIRRKLGDDADNLTYNANEPRVGYRIPKGEEQKQEGEQGTGLPQRSLRPALCHATMCRATSTAKAFGGTRDGLSVCGCRGCRRNGAWGRSRRNGNPPPPR